MFAARLLVKDGCCFGPSLLSNAVKQSFGPRMRLFGSEGKNKSFARLKEVTRTPTWKEKLMAPSREPTFIRGKAFVAGASALGLGAICFYGLGLSNEVGAIDRMNVWPSIVIERIRSTYAYFGGSIIFTAASAVMISRSPVIMNFMMKGSLMSFIGSIAAMLATGYLCRSIPYEEGFGAKQLAWMLHSCVIGSIIAPLTLLGGPIMIRAACYTAGIVGGLSMLAMCAPSDKFLYMGGPLTMGLGVVFASSLGSFFLPPSTALGAGLYSIMLYGGLVLFGAFLLYDTQKAVHRAETHSVYSPVKFDPINNAIGIYADTINIFIRIAMILSGSGNNRRK